MPTYSFDVTLSTHDLLRRGIIDGAHRRIVVSAPDPTDACLMAAQMAGCEAMVVEVALRV